MSEQEKIQSFGDMVNATERMSAPWRETVYKLVKALVITNFLWAVVLGLFIWFAYMAPDATYQTQEFEGHQQVQSSGTEVCHAGERLIGKTDSGTPARREVSKEAPRSKKTQEKAVRLNEQPAPGHPRFAILHVSPPGGWLYPVIPAPPR